ncbi:MAG: hypothetical protein MUO77_17650 [Anaerolineales bacterium]|nr:hypothetical protein [Anaerolineales bacterium]
MKKYLSLHSINLSIILALFLSSCAAQPEFQIVKRCSSFLPERGEYPGTIAYQDSWVYDWQPVFAVNADLPSPFVIYKTSKYTKIDYSVLRSPDGTMLLMKESFIPTGYDAGFFLFSPSDRKVIVEYDVARNGMVSGLRNSSWVVDKNEVIMEGGNGSGLPGYQILDLATSQFHSYFPDWGVFPRRSSYALEFNPKGDVALLRTYLSPSAKPGAKYTDEHDHHLMLWDLRDDKPLWFLSRDELSVVSYDSVQWMPDGEQAVVNAILEMDEYYGFIQSDLFLLDRNKEFFRITNFASVREAVWTFVISPDGKYIAVTTKEEEDQYKSHLYILDMSTRQAWDTCFPGLSYRSDMIWAPDSGFFMFFHGFGESKSLPYGWNILNIKTNEVFKVLDIGKEIIGWTIP